MFVPVVTKDMQLFQSRQPHLQNRFKNVRSRVQSLKTNVQTMNGEYTKTRIVPTGGSTITLPTTNRQPTPQRNSQSVGALPTTAKLASNLCSRSPPKSASFRKPLDPIVEGVAFRCDKKKNNLVANVNLKPTLSSNINNSHFSIRKKIYGDKNEENDALDLPTSPNKSTPNLNSLKIDDRILHFMITTSSTPGLCKPSSSFLPANDTSDNLTGNNAGKRIVKWLTNTFKNKTKSKQKGNCGKNSFLKNENISTECILDKTKIKEEKSWKSIVPFHGSLGETELLDDAKMTVQERLNAVIGSDDENNENINGVINELVSTAS